MKDANGQNGAPTEGIAASVIIPHYNDLSNLDRCLSLLGAQKIGAPFEVIVVDNASAIPFEEIEAVTRGRAKLLLCKEKGAGPARNFGIAVARGTRLAFIDSDCRPRPGWLEAGLTALDRWDFAGGDVQIEVVDPEHMTPVEAFERVFAFRFKDYIERKRFTGSGNMFAHRKVFDSVGGFKTRVSEDIEWSHRAIAGGFTLGYEPRAIVGHPSRRTWDELSRKWARMNSEQFELARTRRWGAFWWTLRSWAVLLSVLPLALKVVRTDRLSRNRDRLAAIAVMARVQANRFVSTHQHAWSSFRRMNEV